MAPFRSRYDTVQLIELVGRIARATRPDDPAALTKRGFDAARASFGEQGLPQADSILRRVPGFSWREVVQLGLDPTRSREHAIAHRHREPPAPAVTREEAIGFLRAARRRRGQGTLSPAAYDRERRRLLARDRRRRHRSQLIWPTGEQISRLFDGWQNALRAAGIEVAAIQQSGLAPARGVDWTDALELVVEVWGTLPGQRELEQAMRTLAAPLARRRLSSAQHRAELQARRQAEGKATPALPRRGRPRPTYTILPAGGIAPELERRIETLRGGQKRRHRRWPDAELVAALVRFLDQLPAGAPATTRRYARYQSEHSELPQLSKYQSSGRRFSDYLERARKERRRPR